MNAGQLIDILKAYGWKLDRIEGSHHIFVKEGNLPVPVPMHGNRDIGYLAKRILKEAGIERKRQDAMLYHCVIEREGEEFIAQFPDMPNVVTCGFSREEALRMAKEALDGVLAAEIARGAPAPPPSFQGGHPVSVASHIAVAMQLRELRGDKSQTEIARKLGLTYQAYQRLENPQRANPTLKTLEKIAGAFGKELFVTIR
ncbi:MAG: type II toxin-antitoxin system HicA family toxin [Desulfovibrio sp.]|jgi:antitoxin HicB|nr:type II toxin-antitoxin system HicA family toxin [Desulfovibrio sp.]